VTFYLYVSTPSGCIGICQPGTKAIVFTAVIEIDERFGTYASFDCDSDNRNVCRHLRHAQRLPLSVYYKYET
jgi:hypothetical protein